MKEKLKRIFFCAFGVMSGAFFLCGNTVFSRIPKNVVIGGVNVGGMTYFNAAAAVREKLAETAPRLKISAPDGEYVLSYPEIGFTDDFYSVFSSAERGGEYSLNVKYFVKDVDRLVNNICAAAEKEAAEPRAEFKSGKFTYYGGESGIKCDGKKLKNDILLSEENAFYPVSVYYTVINPARTDEDIKAKTRLISAFTTYFDGENINRKNNIALAAEALDGEILESGEEFSFNSAVGPRTEKRGYKKAKIISGGKFVEGVGGGVCQVSTTLYNAALLSGMDITRVSAHSLSVGYVEPSFDAMVSSCSDLRFKNPYSSPAYISAETGKNYVSVKFYGAPPDITYSRKSEVIEYIEPGEEILTEGDRNETIIQPKRGLKSRGIIIASAGGETLYEKIIRRDEYKSVRGERIVKNG